MGVDIGFDIGIDVGIDIGIDIGGNEIAPVPLDCDISTSILVVGIDHGEGDIFVSGSGPNLVGSCAHNSPFSQLRKSFRLLYSGEPLAIR